MRCLMVIFEKNWADEFNVKGMAAYTQEEWDKEMALFDLHGDEDINCSFGTNEGWDEERFSRIERCYSTYEISESMYEELKKINNGFFGIFKSPSDFIEIEDEEDDDWEDDDNEDFESLDDDDDDDCDDEEDSL